MKLALMADEKASTSRRLASGRACPDEMCIWELGTNGALSPPPCRPYPVRDTVTGARMNIQAGIPSSGGEARHPAAKASGMAMRRPGQSLGQNLRRDASSLAFVVVASASLRHAEQAIRPFHSIHPSIHHSPHLSPIGSLLRFGKGVMVLLACLSVPLPVCARAHLLACLCSTVCRGLLLLWMSGYWPRFVEYYIAP